MPANDLPAAVPLLAYVVFGLAYCFCGGQFVKTMLVILGAFAGGAIGATFAQSVMPGDVVIVYGAMLLGAFIGVLICALLYRLAIYCVGFAVGGAIAPAVVAATGTDPASGVAMVVGFLAAFITGTLAVTFEKQIMAVFSAALGAVIAVVSLHLMRQGGPLPDSTALYDAYEVAMGQGWWLALVLFAIGVTLQSQGRAKRQPGEDDEG